MRKPHLAILVLFTVIIISIIYINREGYTNYAASAKPTCMSNMNIKFCPFGSKEFSFKGDKICCSSENFSETLGCLDKKVCSLSSDGDDSCGKVYRKYIAEESMKFCPMNSKPNYFEVTSGEAYCHAGPTNADCTGPMNPSQERCRVYRNEKDQSDPMSCYNQRMLDKLPCLTPDKLCKKEMIPLPFGIPPLIGQTFMATTKASKIAGISDVAASALAGTEIPMPKSCYYDESIINIMNKVAPPDWKNNFDFDKADYICSTAGKKFVTKTLPQ